jgi:hypothetical protein
LNKERFVKKGFHRKDANGAEENGPFFQVAVLGWKINEIQGRNKHQELRKEKIHFSID